MRDRTKPLVLPDGWFSHIHAFATSYAPPEVAQRGIS